jgi:SAM-dependent methyltransferase
MKLCSSCNNPFDYASRQCPFCFYEPKRMGGHLAFAPELAEKSEGFAANRFAPLAEKEAGNFWFRSRNRLLVWALQRYFPEAENFMEIGCGTGFVLSGIRRALPELALCGSEIFTEGLTFAAERLPGIELFQMDARRIPFREEFDVIGAFDVLEHIEEDETVLLQMFQATNPGGGIILTVPQHHFLWSVVDDYSFHKRRYTRKELVKKLRRAGFKIVRVTSFVSLILPFMMLSRLKSQRSKDDFDPLAELEIGHHLNLALEKIMGVERSLIEGGVSFPAGGSLLAIAMRDLR